MANFSHNAVYGVVAMTGGGVGSGVCLTMATTAANNAPHAATLDGLIIIAGMQPMITANAAHVDAWLNTLRV
jgi:hypothetical protein